MRRRMRYVLVILLVLIVGGLLLRARLRGPRIKPGSYLLLDVGGVFAEAPPQDIVGRLLRGREHTLIDLLTMIREARVDKRIKGVIVRIGRFDSGWAKVQDIRDALLEFKQSAKPLLALIEHEATGGNKEYYLAATADRVYLSPSSTAPLSGLAAQFQFLGGVWEKLDIQMDVEKIREYKTFGDMIANKEMTAAHREMANSILDSIDAQLVSGLAQGRGLEPAAVRALIDQCPVAPAELEAAHLSNGTKHLQDLQDELGADTPLVQMKDYAQVSASSLGLGAGPKIGVVYAVGTIVTGESGSGVEGQTLGAQTVSDALAEVAADDDVRAIIFRIDSPGGSALASDMIWRATQAARKQKPVIVSMSDVAGSGGYYIAAGATKIVAQPATMTGSIGVVFARPNIRGLLARLGVNTETITRGKFADLDDLTTPLRPDARQKLIDEMTHIYDVFVDRVATGRSLTAERVNEIGRGRVWTGAQAKENGLVDELGGFASAVQLAKQAASIDAKREVELVFYPEREALFERVAELLSTRVVEVVPETLRSALRSVVVPFEEGAVLTVMPESVDVR
ncbi:MAG: signal peptide peptidase SppA [Candidatus Binatia bacterium]